MNDMTDERSAEVLAAHNQWRRYDGETGVPGAPEMGDPAEIGLAIDHVVSRLRSQPSAEAQADWEVAPPGATHYQPHQGAYYKRVSASEWCVWSREDDRELMRWLPSLGTRDNAEWVVRPVDAQPSAPVGVEEAARRLLADEYRKRGIGTGLVNDAGTATNVAIAAIATALAQQPAAVDGDVAWIRLCGSQGEPAGAMTVTAELRDGGEVVLIRDTGNEIDHAVNLAAALAAKQGGRSDD